MWEAKYEKVFTGVTKEAIWAAWSDANNWPKWDSDLEYVSMKSPFQVGTKFILKPKGGPKVTIEITEVVPLKIFSDITRFPLAKMTDYHELEETPAGLKIISRISVEGPLWWLWKKIVASDVAAGVPAQMESLVNYAGQNQT